MVLVVKKLPASAEPWIQSPGREDPTWRRACNALQYSCLENPLNRGAWCKELDMTEAT